MIEGHLLVSIALIFTVKACEDPFSSTTDMTQYIEPAMRAFDRTFTGTVSEDEDQFGFASVDGGVSESTCRYIGETFTLTLDVDPNMDCWNWEWETDSEAAHSGAPVSCTDAECGALTATGTFKLGSESYDVGAAFVLEKDDFGSQITFFVWVNDFEDNIGNSGIEIAAMLTKERFDIVGMTFNTNCGSSSENACEDESCRLNINQ